MEKTMATLLSDEEENLSLHPLDLISLKDARVPGGAFAMRKPDQEQLESLRQSDSSLWPNILVTLCTNGYIVIDGYHRWEIAKEQGWKLKATCKAYQSENAVVEAAFRANLGHGLRASKETKGDYAYWLHVCYPQMEQTEIATRTGMTQGGVSKAIARREEEAKEAARKATQDEQERDTEERNQRMTQSCRKLARIAGQFLADIEDLDDADVVNLVNTTIKKPEDRAKLIRVGQLLLGRTPQTQPQFRATLLSRPTGS
jgi:hypothetical protein